MSLHFCFCLMHYADGCASPRSVAALLSSLAKRLGDNHDHIKGLGFLCQRPHFTGSAPMRGRVSEVAGIFSQMSSMKTINESRMVTPASRKGEKGRLRLLKHGAIDFTPMSPTRRVAAPWGTRISDKLTAFVGRPRRLIPWQFRSAPCFSKKNCQLR